MFERIAVALDGSECSRRALEVAIELAKPGNAELEICSVVDPILLAGTAPPSPAMDLVIRDMEDEAQRRVDAAAEQARGCGVRANATIVSGAPAFELLNYAQRTRSNLIVMGTHGRRGIAHFIMGSVAETVLREASVPVLVVHEPTGSTKHREGGNDAENGQESQQERGDRSVTPA